MGEVSIEQRFHGTVALAILHLRRLAKSNNTEVGLATARELLMIDEEQESFIRECLELDNAIRENPEQASAIDGERIKRLQACILSVNSADPA